MRRSFVAIGLAATLLTGACGDDEEGDGDSGDSPAVTESDASEQAPTGAGSDAGTGGSTGGDTQDADTGSEPDGGGDSTGTGDGTETDDDFVGPGDDESEDEG
jgi:hypothetical protein